MRISLYIRAKKNKSGSVSIQLLSKENGRNHLVKTIGSATEHPEIGALKCKAQEVMDELKSQPSLLPSDESQQLVASISQLVNGNLKLTPFGDNRQSKFDPLDDIKSVN